MVSDHEVPRVVSPSYGTGAKVLGIVGIVLYGIVGYVYLVSGLVVPGVWLIVLWLGWIAGLWVLVRVFRTMRAWTPLVAVGAMAVWAIYVSLGGYLLDWTA